MPLVCMAQLFVSDSNGITAENFQDFDSLDEVNVFSQNGVENVGQ